MRINLTFILIIFGVFTCKSQNYNLHGYIESRSSGEALIGATIYCQETQTGTSSNNYGFYALTLPANEKLTIVISSLGFEVDTLSIQLVKDQKYDLRLKETIIELKEATISSKRHGGDLVSTSTIQLKEQWIENSPTILGEKDVLKVVQLMPGVIQSQEGNVGFHVRGGGNDQNLIILDEAPVYNAQHLFGIFSTFNGDAIKSMKFIKGGFPARYGGRLSSILELTMKEGNKNKFHGEGGIGLISSRFTIEGPLKKDKTSFLASARRTYLDLFTRPITKLSSESPELGYFFYDYNLKIHNKFNKRNQLFFGAYLGRDKFTAIDESSIGDGSSKEKNKFGWGNITTSMRWNHLFTSKAFSNLSIYFSNYTFRVFNELKNFRNNQIETFSQENQIQSKINDLGLKEDMYWNLNNHELRMGANLIYHDSSPNDLIFERNNPPAHSIISERIPALEAALYIEDKIRFGKKWESLIGLRYSSYWVEQKYYSGLEPRFVLGFKISDFTKVNTSYTRMNQYIHLLSNTGLSLPTDLWIPTARNIKPQQADQWTLGVQKWVADWGVHVNLEAYYKHMTNITAYKEGANFLEIDVYDSTPQRVEWENILTQGKGYSYGVEMLLEKEKGKLRGWMSYTFSKTVHQFAELNLGKIFDAPFDRRHNFSVTGFYPLKKNIKLSASWVFSTGRPFSLPLQNYDLYYHLSPDQLFFDQLNPQFTLSPEEALINVKGVSERNNFRTEAYHRLDISLQFHKKKKKYDRYWDITFYNIYNHLNAFFYQQKVVEEPGTQQSKIILEKVSLLPIIPSVSYNFKF